MAVADLYVSSVVSATAGWTAPSSIVGPPDTSSATTGTIGDSLTLDIGNLPGSGTITTNTATVTIKARRASSGTDARTLGALVEFMLGSTVIQSQVVTIPNTGTFDMAALSLPPLAVDHTRAQVDSYRLRLTVQAIGGGMSGTFQILIESATVALDYVAHNVEITSPWLPRFAPVGRATAWEPRASNNPTAWSITGGSLPPGMAINASTGLITGTPTTAGVYTFTITASNGSSSSTLTRTVTIRPHSHADDYQVIRWTGDGVYGRVLHVNGLDLSQGGVLWIGGTDNDVNGYRQSYVLTSRIGGNSSRLMFAANGVNALSTVYSSSTFDLATFSNGSVTLLSPTLNVAGRNYIALVTSKANNTGAALEYWGEHPTYAGKTHGLVGIPTVVFGNNKDGFWNGGLVDPAVGYGVDYGRIDPSLRLGSGNAYWSTTGLASRPCDRLTQIRPDAETLNNTTVLYHVGLMAFRRGVFTRLSFFGNAGVPVVTTLPRKPLAVFVTTRPQSTDITVDNIAQVAFADAQPNEALDASTPSPITLWADTPNPAQRLTFGPGNQVIFTPLATDTLARRTDLFVIYEELDPATDLSVAETKGRASSRAMGVPALGIAEPSTNIAAASIAPTRALGVPTALRGSVTRQVDGIARKTVMGSPAILPGAVNRPVAGIARASRMGAPTLSPGPVTLQPTAIGRTTALGSPVLTNSGGTAYVLTGGIAPARALGVPALLPGSVTRPIDGIAASRTLGMPTVLRGGVAVAPAGISSSARMGVPVASTGAVTLTLGGIPRATALGQPAVAAGAVTLALEPVPAARRIGVPAVTARVTVQPDGIASTRAVGLPRLGAVTIATLDGIAPRASVGAPVIAPGAVTVQPASIAPAAAMGVPVLATTSTLLQVDGIATRTIVNPIEVRTSTTIQPAAIAPRRAFGAFTVSAITTVAPAGIGSQAVAGAIAVVPGAVYLVPAGIASGARIGWIYFSGGTRLPPPAHALRPRTTKSAGRAHAEYEGAERPRTEPTATRP